MIGALLGADEFGFATAPLIAAGCIMMRKCHLNTCPVGVATQDPVLRAKFTGKPEHVINFFFFVAEEVREIMAQLGFRTFNEMIGQSDQLDKDRAIEHWKARGLDFTKLFHKPYAPKGVAIYNSERQDHGLDKVLDVKLIEIAKPALESKKAVKAELEIKNVNRSTGAMLSGEVAKRYGHAGLAEDTIWLSFKGTAGQAFGAWVAHGVTLDLVGEGNDYVGKGLSGGKLIVRPDPKSGITPEESIIVGNTVLYGAITGECYFRGVAGERFAVRNSGAYAVVEGTGDHGCEYMTGGVVVVLGPTGRNFAAGMSGGIAYVLDEKGDFEGQLNKEMVQLEALDRGPGLARRNSRKQDGDVAIAVRSVMVDMREQDAERLHALISRHAHYTNSRRAQAILKDFAAYLPKFKKVMPIEYRRALAELAKARETNRRGGRRRAVSASHVNVFGQTGSIEYRDERTNITSCEETKNGQADRVSGNRPRRPQIPAGRRAREALEGIRRPAGGARGQEAGRPLHGLRHSLLPQRLPGQQSDPGLERPRLPRRLEGSCRESAFDEQLPRSHGPRLPGAVRSRLHAQHRRQAGHDQNHRVLDRRSRPRGRLGAAAAARKEDRQEGRDHRLGSRRASPPPSSWRAPATTSTSMKRTRGPAACSSTASPISRWKRLSSRGASSRWKPRA